MTVGRNMAVLHMILIARKMEKIDESFPVVVCQYGKSIKLKKFEVEGVLNMKLNDILKF